jgi:hypothetical protein
MFLHKIPDKVTQLSVIDGRIQIVCLSRLSGAQIQSGRKQKFLSQCIFLRIDAVTAIQLQIFYLYLIQLLVQVVSSTFFPAK